MWWILCDTGMKIIYSKYAQCFFGEPGYKKNWFFQKLPNMAFGYFKRKTFFKEPNQ